MKTAYIYCRVSTKDQVQNLSLPTQKKACLEYCERQGYSVAEIFIEEGESAKTADRPEFKKMLAFCQKNRGYVNTVVVYSLSRFSRNTNDHTTVRALLAGLGVNLRSVTEPIDESSTGRFMETIMSGVAQLDNDVRTERTVAGMKAALESGRWTYKGPLGYLNTKSSQNGKTLIQDPAKAPLVRQAFELYSTGLYTKHQVLEKITTLGLRGPNGKKLQNQVFDKMLRKPIYAGWLTVNNWGSRTRGKFEPIISQEVFDRVQTLLRGKKIGITPYQRNNEDFPLRHYTRCETCGKPLTGSWSKGRTQKYAYYRCANSKCKGVNEPKEKLESLFLKHLDKLKPSPESIRLFKAVMLDSWKEKHADSQRTFQKLKKDLESLKERKNQLVDLLLVKTLDPKTYQEQTDRLQVEIGLKELEVSQIHEEDLDLEGILDFAEFVISNPEKLWKDSALNQKQRFQKVLFPQGLKFGNQEFGTSESAPIYTLISQSQTPVNTLVAPRGIEPRSNG
jgi:site-specific DNA recombinase